MNDPLHNEIVILVLVFSLLILCFYVAGAACVKRCARKQSELFRADDVFRRTACREELFPILHSTR